jgi:hypothetical protein
MKNLPGLLILLAVLTAMLAACGATPEPTQPPPTQTARIVIVTTTPCAQEVAGIQPTQTPWIIVATPTPVTKAKATATKTSSQATANPEGTADPTETTDPAQTEPASTASPAAPADTPNPSAFKYPPPVLLGPPENQPVGWRDSILLKWSSAGELAEDEYYHVHVERPPKTDADQWYGDYVYTKDVEQLLGGAFLAPFHLPANQGHGVVYWWVRVVRKVGEDQSGKPIGMDISPHSERRTFITEPKPE